MRYRRKINVEDYIPPEAYTHDMKIWARAVNKLAINWEYRTYYSKYLFARG